MKNALARRCTFCLAVASFSAAQAVMAPVISAQYIPLANALRVIRIESK